MPTRHVIPQEVPVKEVFDYLLGGIGPRPIALVSTISPEGQVNLSPFSFFNAFGANPPTIGFSPSRRLRDNTVKDTYTNLRATGECVVQAATYAMVQQVSLASTEYPSDVNEFDKTGLTSERSDLVRPPRVKESPFQMECRVKEIIELGGRNASGNLVLCEVVKFHIAEDLFVDGIIHPDRIDLVARMGGDFYCRAKGPAIFIVRKPIARLGIGYDRLPDYVKQSTVLTANNLGQLGNSEAIPSQTQVRAMIEQLAIVESSREAFHRHQEAGQYRAMLATAIWLSRHTHPPGRHLFELCARRALDFEDVEFAWGALIYGAELLPNQA